MTVHAFHCPQCNAVLDVQTSVSLVRCSFCSTRCRVDWHGSDPVLSEEAEEFARLLSDIDFDALEQGLNELEDEVDQRIARDELDVVVGRLQQREQIDRLARQLAASGKAQEFIEGVSNLEIDETEEHEVLLRNLLSRVAVRAAAQPGEVAGIPAPGNDNVRHELESSPPQYAQLLSSGAPPAEHLDRQDADRQLERKAKLWAWLPWVGLLAMPLLLIGLAVVLTIVIAVALPKNDDRPWLGLALGLTVLSSPLAGIAWLWFGLRRRRALVALLNARARMWRA